MQVFHCDVCEGLVFFENSTCVTCGNALAFLPDQMRMATLETQTGGDWKVHGSSPGDSSYRLCVNYSQHNVCNWSVPADDPNPLCQSCRLTQKTHNLSGPAAYEIWYKIEVAKRRLIYSLLVLKCPIENKTDAPDHGLAFEYGEDIPGPDGKPYFTGHENGLIALNIAEADDVERKRRQLDLGEPYRTLLGHFRHESGHYYWDRLISQSSHLGRFRELFGDERADYSSALQQHYQTPRQVDWLHSYVSEYASVHPWEDWAETWAHYLHMVDTLETATCCGLSLRPRRKDEPSLKTPSRLPQETGDFDQLIDSWFPLTYALNNLNRGLGLADSYPFVLMPPVIEKLKFIHEVIRTSIACNPLESSHPQHAFWARLFKQRFNLFL